MTEGPSAVVEQSEQFFKALTDTLLEHEDIFGTPFVGLSDWNTADYPASEVIPQSAVYQGQGEYQYAAFSTLYFRRSRMTNYVEDIVPVLGAVVETGYNELAKTDLHAFRVDEIEYFPAEDDNRTSLTAITLRWTAEGPADLAKR